MRFVFQTFNVVFGLFLQPVHFLMLLSAPMRSRNISLSRSSNVIIGSFNVEPIYAQHLVTITLQNTLALNIIISQIMFPVRSIYSLPTLEMMLKSVVLDNHLMNPTFFNRSKKSVL